MIHRITEIDIIIRLCLAFLAGGIERSSRSQAAASLWLTGAGMNITALTAAVPVLITLILLNKIERKIFPDDRILPVEKEN